MFQDISILLLLPIVIIWFILLIKHTYSDIAKRRITFASIDMLNRITNHRPTKRPIAKWVLFLFGLILIIVGLARPVGLPYEEVVEGPSLDIVFALDISKSMLANDINGNRRIDVAKAIIKHVVSFLKHDRVGLVVFSGETMVQSPLTIDKATFLSFLDRVDPSLLTKQGTNIAQAIETSLARFDYLASQSRVIVLFSDGEDHNKSKLQKIINEANKRNVSIITVGIGTEKGGYIPIGHNIWGEPVYLTYKGKRVITRLEEKTLKMIANETGGKYLKANSIENASEIAKYLENLPRLGYIRTTQPVSNELFHIPLLISFIILLFEWIISERIPYEREKDHWLKRI